MKRVICACVFLVGIGCSTAPAMKPLEFLTREGCVQTTTMRGRLDEAIKAIGQPMPYAVVDLDTLPATDTRKGYPTPTILRGGKDLFDMPAPTPPYPEPT